MTTPTSNNLYGIGVGTAPNGGNVPIFSTASPASTNVKHPLGQRWINTTSNLTFTLTSFTASGGVLSATWTAEGSGAGALDTLTGDVGGVVTPAIGNINVLGTAAQIVTTGAGATLTLSIPDPFAIPGAVTVATTLGVTGLSTLAALTQVGTASINGSGAATTTIGSTGAGGAVVVASAGLITVQSARNNAQAILIDATIGGIDINASAASAGEDIDITATGSSINLVATEAAVLNAIRLNASAADGGIDIDCGTGGITVDSTGAFSIDGAAASNVTVTGAGIDLLLSSALGSVLVRSTEDVALAIKLHANGGTSETIQLHSDLGTGVGSVNILSDVGGITLAATGLASADAINLEAGAGGIDVDAALQINITSSQNAVDAIRILSSAGGMDIDAVGAATEDINITNTGGSIVLVATENVTDAVVIQASGAAGGIDLIAGTNHVSVTGNLNFVTAGNKILSANVGAAAAAGANSFGSVTLVNGTETVATTAVTASSLIYMSRMTVGTTGANDLGILSVGTIVASTSFVINAWTVTNATVLQADDQSVIGWMIVN